MNTSEQKRVKLLAQYAYTAMAQIEDISPSIHNDEDARDNIQATIDINLIVIRHVMAEITKIEEGF